jgi:nitrous oxide reductase accessory protein NosL
MEKKRLKSDQGRFVMKKVLQVMTAILLTVGMGVFFSTGAVSDAFAQEDVTKHASCAYCGMDRAKFSHSRVLVEYEDGSSFGACSLHCAAVDMAVHIDKTPKAILVGDYNTKKLIDAEKASWVMGGNKMGVMTKRAKWAFESKADAEKLIQENGGQAAGFEQAIKAAYEDMYEDTKMIRERRKMRKMKSS